LFVARLAVDERAQHSRDGQGRAENYAKSDHGRRA
jgi:hypothetical protein